MGTPLSRIYAKFLSQLDDKELLLVDEDILEDLMLEYLENATVDFTQCRKDLSFTPPEKCEVRVYTNGQTSQIDFTPKEGNISSIKIENLTTRETYEEGTHFTLEEGKIVFLNLIEEEGELVFFDSVEGELSIQYTLDGYFKEDLEIIEIRILALGMLLSYLKPKIMTQDSLKQFVSDKDFSKLSGANMLLRLMGLKNNIEKELDTLQGRYAFKDFEGWN